MRPAVSLLAALVTATAATAADAPPFIDKFPTAPDPSRWLVSDGWSNGDWQVNDWRRSQIIANGSGLVISLDKNPASKNGYSSGEFQSRSAYRYGYFEVRMRAAAGPGIVTGFFTYIGPPQGQPWNVVDVEILGKDTHVVSLTYHVGNQQHATLVKAPFDLAEADHVYGFDWQPQFIRWYIDGHLVHEDTGDKLPLPTEPQKVFFDLWGANIPEWTGKFVWPGRPIRTQVRCIAVAPRFTGAVLC